MLRYVSNVYLLIFPALIMTFWNSFMSIVVMQNKALADVQLFGLIGFTVLETCLLKAA